MPHRAFVLFADSENWRLAARTGSGTQFSDVQIPAQASPEQIASVVASALAAAGHTGEATLLAIPSAWCFSASIETGDLPRHDARAMLYRLEEKLPFAAEGVVADFVRQGGAALGVCAKLPVLAPLIEALEARNIPVQSVMPTALLAAQSVEFSNDGARILLCGHADGQVDLIAFDGAAPVHWSVGQPEGNDLELQLEMACMSLSTTPVIETVQLEPNLIARLEKSLSQTIRVHQGDVDSLVVQSAEKVLSGRRRPWIELRRGPLAIRDSLRLYRRPINAALAGAAVLLICISGALLYRAHRYQQVATSSQRQMAEEFREQFPGWDVPSNVRVIVESERRKAAAAAAAAAPAHAARSALRSLTDVLGRLPGDSRFSIGRMSFGEGSFEMEGQVKSNDQLDGIAAAARQAGMDVEPPEAHKNADGSWNFIIRGALPSSDKPAGEVAREGS
jgi:hypothetical protein